MIISFLRGFNLLHKLIIFTLGYKNGIKDLFNIFIYIKKFWINFEHKLCNILNGNIIKHEISDRNKEDTKKVNINILNIIEYLSRAFLLYNAGLSKDTDEKMKINDSIKNKNTENNEKIKI